jgi:hypothetical protein
MNYKNGDLTISTKKEEKQIFMTSKKKKERRMLNAVLSLQMKHFKNVVGIKKRERKFQIILYSSLV